MFGNEFKLNIGGKDSHNTILGGIFTVLTWITTIVLYWYFGQDMYLKINPTYFSKIGHFDNNPMLTINQSNFFFGIKLGRLDETNFDDIRFFQFSANYYNFMTNIDGSESFNGSSINFGRHIRKCNTNHIDNVTLYDKKMYDYYCADFNGLQYGGEYGIGSRIAALEYTLLRCNTETEKTYNITCATNEEITELKNIYLFYYTYETVVNPTDFSKPVEVQYKRNFWDIDLRNTTTNIYFQYSLSNLTSDTGVFFEESNTIDFLTLDSIRSNSKVQIQSKYNVKDDDNILLTVTFLMNNKNPLYIRTYVKIPDVIAQVGGVMSLFTPFIEFFIRIFIDNSYAVYLYYSFFKIQKYDNDDINNINNINIKLEGKSNNCLQKSGMLELQDIRVNVSNNNSSNNSNNLSKSTNNILQQSIEKKSLYQNKLKDLKKKEKELVLNKEIIKVIEAKNKNSNNINISQSSRLAFTLCCGESKTDTYSLYKLINIVEAELSKKCDFLEILRTQDQFRLFKKLILNEGQCLLLNNRDLKILTEETPLINEDFETDQILKENLIFEYLKSRKENSTFNQIDQLLVKYLPKAFKERITSDLNI